MKMRRMSFDLNAFSTLFIGFHFLIEYYKLHLISDAARNEKQGRIITHNQLGRYKRQKKRPKLEIDRNKR